MSKTKWIEDEIMAMQLDRAWGQQVRDIAKTIAAYPETVAYTPDWNLQSIMGNLSKDEWQKATQVLCTGLKSADTDAEFETRFEQALYGMPQFDLAQTTFLETYLDLYHKFYIQNNTMFAYKLQDFRRADTMLFTRLSDMEIIEYALYCTEREHSGNRSPSNVLGYGFVVEQHPLQLSTVSPLAGRLWEKHSGLSIFGAATEINVR